MKMQIMLMAIALVLACLKVGFYGSLFAEDSRRVFFVKQYPTLQPESVNFFASGQDVKPLQKLSAKERQRGIDYCRYRLGIASSCRNKPT